MIPDNFAGAGYPHRNLFMKLEMPPFQQARVLVVGDVMLDRYWHGPTHRISPEAPVPVVKVDQTWTEYGRKHPDAPDWFRRRLRALGGGAAVALDWAAALAQTPLCRWATSHPSAAK